MNTQELLYDIITKSEEHLSADRIYFLAKAQNPSISVATIYRNLSSMSEKGIVGHVAVPHSSARFDKSPSSHPHGICPLCGDVFDIPAEKINKALSEIIFADDFSYQMTVSCLCKKCREAETNK